MRFLRLAITVFSIAAALSGCQYDYAKTTRAMPVGKARPAVDVSAVTIYIDPPSKYETVGVIEACCIYPRTKQNTQDIIINDVKSKAAKIGANGILLIKDTEKKGSVGVQDGGCDMYVDGPGTVEWRAIFVISE
jgi:hypothetical protein